jgi:antitoxin VapB
MYILVYTMTQARTKTFKSGNSEAIRLPKEMAFGEGVELVLQRTGDVLTIRPARPSLEEMFDELARLPAPQEIEVRDTEEIPERDGL